MTLKSIGRLAALPMMLAAFAAPALADEMWGNQDTTVFWEAEDVNGYAVFSFTVTNPKVQRSGKIFLYGLTAAMTDRGTFGGYWAGNTGPGDPCPMPVIDAEGNENWYWGAVELTFTSPNFPTGWSAALGHCFDIATEFWTVLPAGGEGPK